MKVGNWRIDIWRSKGFAFLFSYEWSWNNGDQKRLYLLFWEVNFNYEPRKVS